MKARNLLLMFFITTICNVNVLAANVEVPQAKKPQSNLAFEDNSFLEPTHTIVNSIDITVPGDTKFFPKKIDTIQDALHAIKNYRIAPRVTVTIKLMQDAIDYDTINVDHPDGNRIHIVGNCGENKNCAIQFKPGVNGIVTDGGRIGYLDKLKLIGHEINDEKNPNYSCSICKPVIGIFANNSGEVVCGTNMYVEKFFVGIQAQKNSHIQAANIICSSNAGTGMQAMQNSYIEADNSKLVSNRCGISVIANSTFYGDNVRIENSIYGVFMSLNAVAHLINAYVSNNRIYDGNIVLGSYIDISGINDKSRFSGNIYCL